MPAPACRALRIRRAGRVRAGLAVAALAAAGIAPSRACADPLPALSSTVAAIRAALDSVAAGRNEAGIRSAASDAGPRRLDYLWVVRTSLTDSQKVERAVERAREMGVKGLLAQVVGRGDAYYRSELLPRAEPLADDGFDPLGLLVSRAHAAGLEVHAWVNCMLVWSGPKRPRDPRHVVNARPEWVARLADGRSMTGLSARQRRRMNVEGAFLSPAHPGVGAWLGSIVKEIGLRYAVDGVHLDYVRLPGVKLRPDAGAGAATPGGAGRAAATAPERAPAGGAEPGARAGALRTQAECARVTAMVGEVRDSLGRVRPRMALSAAVLADTAVAEGSNAQRWPSWLREGLIDRAFVMCYAPPIQTVVAQLAGFAASQAMDRVVPGIAVYNTPPATAAAKIRAARALGFPEIALYSHDALESRPGYWPRLRSDLDGESGAVPAPGGTGGAR